MLINQGTAISTTRILLVPYEKSHVPTYHEWMKDAEIQATTASEPLSLSEEYDMQASWRTDHDKLTFIACLPLRLLSQPTPQPHSGSPSQDETLLDITPGTQDSPDKMLGDVNLFLTPSDEEEEEDGEEDDAGKDSLDVTGELELMIASPAHRKQGYGRATILAFMRYIQLHLGEILEEYARGVEGGDGDIASKSKSTGPSESNSKTNSTSKSSSKPRLSHLRVKIGSENVKSINLFESIGFVKTAGGPNYFGEVELRFAGELDEETVGGLMGRFGVEGYEEVRYGG